MIKLGIVGVGYWGKNLLRTFYRLSNCEIITVSDVNKDTINKHKKNYPDINFTTDYKEIANNNDIDAVVISTQAKYHYEIALDCIKNKKHVFIEKPMTLKIENAEKLIKMADQQNVHIMVGHLMLYHSAINYIKEMVDNKDLGDIYYLYCHRLNLGIVRQTENALWSLAPHDISIALYILGDMPKYISATGGCFLQNGIEDITFLSLKYKNDKIAQIQSSWLDPHKTRKLIVVGSKKMVVFDDTQPNEKVKIFNKGVDINHAYDSYGDLLTLRQGDINIPRIKMSEPLKVECNHFLECIEQNKSPLSNGKNGYDVVKILNYATESLKNNGKVVKVNE